MTALSRPHRNVEEEEPRLPLGSDHLSLAEPLVDLQAASPAARCPFRAVQIPFPKMRSGSTGPSARAFLPARREDLPQQLIGRGDAAFGLPPA
jgi:hypothetical protein